MVVGGAIWFGGWLVLASKYYRFHNDQYFIMQMLAVGSAFAAMYVGMVYQFDGLAQAAITFLGVYVLAKFFEIRWREYGYAWMLLALAALVYAGAAIAERYG
jgi:hypothetical protein